MRKDEKPYAIIGIIFSLIFSFVLIIASMIISTLAVDPDFVNPMIETSENPLIAVQLVDCMKIVANYFFYYSYLMFYVGVIMLLTIVLIYRNNRKSMGKLILILNISYLFGFRLIEFILFFKLGNKLVKNNYED